MNIKMITLGAAIGLLLTGCAGIDSGTADKEEISKLDEALVKYERTGEMKNCINPARIRHSRVVDDTHIIFEVTASKVYLNTLPRKCSSLGFHRAIAYQVRGGSLCKGDLFEVFDSTSHISGAHCSFGAFEKLDKKAKDVEKDPK